MGKYLLYLTSSVRSVKGTHNEDFKMEKRKRITQPDDSKGTTNTHMNFISVIKISISRATSISG